MAFKLKPYAEILAMNEEKLDAEMAPLRARAVRARAELKICKLSEKMVTLEADIHRACIGKEIDFDRVADLIDEFDLAERRLKTVQDVAAQLFPVVLVQKT
jgi:hypothetical protein